MAEVTQFCIGLENKPGVFARLCGTLKRAGVRINGLCVSDDEDCCWVNIVASPVSTTQETLREQGYNFFTEKVLAVQLDDRPATMERVAGALAKADINIDYVYGSGESDSPFTLLMHVSDLAGAQAVLED